MKEKQSPYIPVKERMGMPLVLTEKVDGKGVILSVVANPSLDQQLEHNRSTLEIDRPKMIRDLLIREDPNRSKEDREKARGRLVDAFRQAKIASAAIGIAKEQNNRPVYDRGVESRARKKIKETTLEMGGTPDQARRFANMFPRHTKGVQRIEIKEYRRRQKEVRGTEFESKPVRETFLPKRRDLKPASS